MTHEINIADFAAFCRSKGEETFDVYRCRDCALGQYAKTLGATHIGADHFDVGGVRYRVPSKAYVKICLAEGGEASSFSALADRLEALMETDHA